MRLRTPKKCQRRLRGFPPRPWLRMVQSEAKSLGVRLTKTKASYILWNETTFPFGTEARCREQVRDSVWKNHRKGSW